jgi:hypothetical protein
VSLNRRSLPVNTPHKDDTYRVDDWGQVTVQKRADETDILIEFDVSSLDARRRALAFAKELSVQMQEQSPGTRAEFVRASDHYHVRFKDFGSAELKAAHEFQSLLTRRYCPLFAKCTGCVRRDTWTRQT